MRRRDFLKTIAAAAAVAGLARLDPVTAGAPVSAAGGLTVAAAPELPLVGNPYTLTAGAHAEFRGAYDALGLDPIALHALPPEWRDRFILGIEV